MSYDGVLTELQTALDTLSEIEAALKRADFQATQGRALMERLMILDKIPPAAELESRIGGISAGIAELRTALAESVALTRHMKDGSVPPPTPIDPRHGDRYLKPLLRKLFRAGHISDPGE
jgi:hypothetical protein